MNSARPNHRFAPSAARTLRTLTSAILLGITLVGGPGFALSEAWIHAHRTHPGHGFRSHVEARGVFDHDDACRAWIVSTPVRPIRAAALRVCELAATLGPTETPSYSPPTSIAPPRLPPPRGPPSSV